MNLTAQLKLEPTASQAADLARTLVASNAACDYISGMAWDSKTFRQFDLHRLCYREVRNEMTPTLADKAYAAGFLDGEGWIGITRPRARRGHTVTAEIVQKDPAPLLWMQERWGDRLRLTSEPNAPGGR